MTEAGPLTHRAGPGPARLGAPRRAALRRPGPARGRPRQPAGRQRRRRPRCSRPRWAASRSPPRTRSPSRSPGPSAPVAVDGRAVGFAEPVRLPAGATLRVGRATRGVRSYVAVAGGIAVEPVLGSRSTDTLACVGPPRAARRRRAAARASRRGPRRAWTSGRRGPSCGRRCSGCTRGRAPTGSTTAALATLTGTSYAVSGDSNRVGLRLEGRR